MSDQVLKNYNSHCTFSVSPSPQLKTSPSPPSPQLKTSPFPPPLLPLPNSRPPLLLPLCYRHTRLPSILPNFPLPTRPQPLPPQALYTTLNLFHR